MTKNTKNALACLWIGVSFMCAGTRGHPDEVYLVTVILVMALLFSAAILGYGWLKNFCLTWVGRKCDEHNAKLRDRQCGPAAPIRPKQPKPLKPKPVEASKEGTIADYEYWKDTHDPH